MVAWAGEKTHFVSQPLDLSSLPSAKAKFQEFSAAQKGVKFASKNVQEMQRELAKISQIADTDDLGDKMTEAEAKKADAEAALTEKVMFCERTAF